jgi:hypothetical protein
MKREYLLRQSELIPLEVLSQPIKVVGAGSVGTFTVLALTKMGFSNITVFDNDTVDVENMNCQLFKTTDISQKKVVALAQNIFEYTGVRIEAVAQKYEGGVLDGIVIAAVDSMAVRKLIWEEHHNMSLSTKLIIDPRMAIETALLYAMKPGDVKDGDSYATTLYSDDEAVQERCTNKATGYTAMMIGAQVAKTVKDFLTGKPYGRIVQWSIANNQQVVFNTKKDAL